MHEAAVILLSIKTATRQTGNSILYQIPMILTLHVYQIP